VPFLRSDVQGDVLALLLLAPDDEFSIADVQRRTSTAPAVAHREVNITRVSGADWDESTAACVRTVRARRLTAIRLHEEWRTDHVRRWEKAAGAVPATGQVVVSFVESIQR